MPSYTLGEKESTTRTSLNMNQFLLVLEPEASQPLIWKWC